MGLAEDRAAFLKGRKKGIGGSDVAAIFGLSKWTSPGQVYADKRGELPDDTRQRMFLLLGNALEPTICELYEQQTGVKTRASHKQHEHPDHSFLLANLDRRRKGRIVEFKTSRNPDDWGTPGTDQVPLPYLLQVQHYMFVTGAPLADIAVLWMNRTYPELAIYTVEANADLHDKMLAKLTEFWHGVQNGIPPAPVRTDDAKALWQKPTGEEALADDDALEAWSKYHEVRAKIEQLKQEEDAAKLQLMESMQTASYLRRGTKLLATWHRNKDSTRIDAAKLRTKYPEIAEECSYVTPGPRVLRVQSDERTG